jgi:hypothetical protein
VRTGAYYICPFGWPVIECFFGGEGARIVAENGPKAGFVHAREELATLFGSAVSHVVRPLCVSNWSRTPHVSGAYGCALPGHAAARQVWRALSMTAFSSLARRRSASTSRPRMARTTAASARPSKPSRRLQWSARGRRAVTARQPFPHEKSI